MDSDFKKGWFEKPRSYFRVARCNAEDVNISCFLPPNVGRVLVRMLCLFLLGARLTRPRKSWQRRDIPSIGLPRPCRFRFQTRATHSFTPRTLNFHSI